MFAGIPGTGIGALFFALICLAVSLTRGLRKCGLVPTLSAIWIAGCILLIYGQLPAQWLSAEHFTIGLSLAPVLLLGTVLTAAAVAARVVLRK
jgi:hypothetical protein